MANTSFVAGTPDDEFISQAAQAAIAASEFRDEAEAILTQVQALHAEIEAALDNYLPLAGGTMTGFISLHANPSQNAHAANKGYVDNLVSTTFANQANVYDIGVYFEGSPEDGFETILLFIASTQFVLPIALSNSHAYAMTAPDGDVVFDLQKNGDSFGTITFPAGENEGVFSALLATTFEPGDILEIIGPEYADAYLADITINLKGTVSA